jgi:crotonobetainyl-CoA:carnitine CoA-transferase CaiB-like acyl-CoA transferase
VSSPPTGALGGIRVLDLCGPFGAFGARMLADLGADVVKVEPPGGDAMRSRPPFAGPPGPERSLPFFLANANKRGVVIDLDSDPGRDEFRRLAASADVVMESMPPGAMDARGLGYKSFAQEQPGLVWVAITPFGQDGPWAGYRLSELSAQAAGGALYLTGEKGERPVLAGGHVAEKIAGYTAALAVATAIFWREHGGTGQFIDLSIQEAVVSQMESFTTKVFYSGDVYSREGRLYPRTYPAGIFPCSDGWVSLVAGPVHQWHALRDWIDDDRLRAVRFDDLGTRMRERPYLDEIICAWTSGLGKDFLFHEGQRRRIPVGVCFAPAEVTRDEHLAARNYTTRLKHQVLGDLTVPGRPYLLSRTPWELSRPAPLLGEHNRELLPAPARMAPP